MFWPRIYPVKYYITSSDRDPVKQRLHHDMIYLVNGYSAIQPNWRLFLHPRQKVTCGLFVLLILQNLSASNIRPLNNIKPSLHALYMYRHSQIKMYKPFRNLQFAYKIALTSNYHMCTTFPTDYQKANQRRCSLTLLRKLSNHKLLSICRISQKSSCFCQNCAIVSQNSFDQSICLLIMCSQTKFDKSNYMK